MTLDNAMGAALRGSRIGIGVLAAVASCSVLGCSQHPDEMARLRAEITALRHEIDALKVADRQAEESRRAQEGPVSSVEASPPSSAAATVEPSWQERIDAFEQEPNDKKWIRLRQGPLLQFAIGHIKAQGASLQSVACRSTACLVRVDVPASIHKPYVPMSNPWAETSMLTHTKAIYGNKTRWSYLISRHSQDREGLGTARVDPMSLATPVATPVSASAPTLVAEQGASSGAGTTDPSAAPANVAPPSSAASGVSQDPPTP